MTERRWLYALGGLVVALAIGLGVVLIASDDSDDSASDTTTSSSAASTTAPTSTVAPTTTPPTTAAPPTTVSLPPITNDPQSYAKFLFAAWLANNQSAATQVASADAIAQMFSQPASAQNPYTFGSCDPAAGSVYCTWTAQSGAKITMTVRNITGGLPIQVVAVMRS